MEYTSASMAEDLITGGWSNTGIVSPDDEFEDSEVTALSDDDFESPSLRHEAELAELDELADEWDGGIDDYALFSGYAEALSHNMHASGTISDDESEHESERESEATIVAETTTDEMLDNESETKKPQKSPVATTADMQATPEPDLNISTPPENDAEIEGDAEDDEDLGESFSEADETDTSPLIETVDDSEPAMDSENESPLIETVEESPSELIETKESDIDESPLVEPTDQKPKLRLRQRRNAIVERGGSPGNGVDAAEVQAFMKAFVSKISL